MTARPVRKRVLSHLKPQKQIIQSSQAKEEKKNIVSVSAHEIEKTKQLLKHVLSFRPWYFKSEIARATPLTEQEVNDVLKELEINRSIQSADRSTRKRKIIQDVRNALDSVDPVFRLYTITRRDFLPTYLTGLSTDVRMTEVFGDDMKMRTKMKTILYKNMASALRNDYKYWKQFMIKLLHSVEKGYSAKEIAKAEGVKRSPFIIDEEMVEEMKKILKEVGSASKISKSLTPDENEWIQKTAKRLVENLPKEITEIRLCPAYASNSKETRGMQRMIADVREDGTFRTFSRATYNIPFLNYTPPKRLQMASHSIAKNRTHITLLYGEEPRVKAEYNDLAGKGINAKLEIVRSGPLYVKTYGGGIVVTEGFAKKMRYRLRSPAKNAIAMNPNDFVPEGTYVRRGDRLVLSPIEQLGMGMEDTFSPYEGKVHWVSDPKKHVRKDGYVFYTRKYVIERESDLIPGDKLMTRTGIRGVITDIIPGDEPKIYVNYEDVWKEMDPELDKKGRALREKEKRGEPLTDEEKLILREWKKIRNKRKASVFKEAEAGDGYVFVYPEPDGFVKDYNAQGLKMSWTMLMGALERTTFDKLWMRYFFPRKEIHEVMKALHLKLVKTEDGKYKFVQDEEEPTPDKDGFVIKFKHRVGNKEYNYLYVPRRYQRFFYDSEHNLRRFGFWPEMTEAEKRVMWNKNFKVYLAKRLYQLLFAPRYAMALDRKIVAADVPQDTVVIGEKLAKMLGVKDGDLVGFRKEPITDSNSILTLKVKVDKTGKYDHVIGINPFVAEQAQSDFDGDSVVADTVIAVRFPLSEKSKTMRGNVELMTIEELFNMFKEGAFRTADGREIIDLRDKDIQILTGEYKNGKAVGRFAKPSYIMRHKVKKRVFYVKDTDAGVPLVTEDHSLMSNGKSVKPTELGEDFKLDTIDDFNHSGMYSDGEKLNKITELDLADYVDEMRKHLSSMYDIEVHEKEIHFVWYYRTMKRDGEYKHFVLPRFIKMDERFGLLAGLYLSEGSCYKLKAAYLLSNANPLLIKLANKIMKKVFGVEGKIDRYRKEGCFYDMYRLKFPLQVALAFRILFGSTLKEKRLPRNFTKFSKKFLKGLIRGYMLGDGALETFDWYLRSGSLSSSSRVLISQLVFIVKFIIGGKNFRFKVKVKKNGELHYDVFWNIDRNGYNFEKMRDRMEEIEYDGYVYDIEVPSTHTFVDVLGGVVLHNTASLFVPHPGEEFIPKYPKDIFKKGIDAPLPSKEEIEKTFTPDEDLADEVRLYNKETREQDNKEIKIFGGLRKRAFTLYPHLPVSLKRLNEIFNVERVMKAKGVDADEEIRKELERYIKKHTMYSKERRKLASLYMMIPEFIKKFERVMDKVIDLEIQPNKYLLDKIIYWTVIGKPKSLIHMGKKIEEMEEILKDVRRQRHRIEQTIQKEKKHFTEIELRHMYDTVRQLYLYEQDLAATIRELKQKAKKKGEKTNN